MSIGMRQLPMESEPGRRRPRGLGVHVDYGELTTGATHAHHVGGENGNEYIIKGPTFNPAMPYAAANEMIAALLGQELGLPVLDFRLVEMDGNLFFGSAWMDHGTFFPAMTAGVFARCLNRHRAYNLVAFDAWLVNADRHRLNLIARHEDARLRNESRLMLIFNDHSHCLLPPPRRPHQLRLLVRSPAADYMKHLEFVRDAITDRTKLAAAVDDIEDLSDDCIRTCVRRVPDAFLPEHERVLVEDFLVERREYLRESFNVRPRALPALVGGTL